MLYGLTGLLLCSGKHCLLLSYGKDLTVSIKLMCCWEETHPCHIRNLFCCTRDARVKLVLNNRQKSAPIILLEIAEDAQGGFHMLVYFLTLLIHLWVVCA
jgi:hypothetical protein